MQYSRSSKKLVFFLTILKETYIFPHDFERNLYFFLTILKETCIFLAFSEADAVVEGTCVRLAYNGLDEDLITIYFGGYTKTFFQGVQRRPSRSEKVTAIIYSQRYDVYKHADSSTPKHFKKKVTC